MANKYLEKFIEEEVLTIITTHLTAAASGTRVLIQHRCSKGYWVASNCKISSSGSSGSSSARIKFDIDGGAEVDTEELLAGGNYQNRVASYEISGRFSCKFRAIVSASGVYNVEVSNPNLSGLKMQPTVHKPAQFPKFVRQKSEVLLAGIHKRIAARIKSRGRAEMRSPNLSSTERAKLL
ncbi:MAG: hypothetical protein AAF468_11765 [Pseudomonadota bacterium]